VPTGVVATQCGEEAEEKQKFQRKHSKEHHRKWNAELTTLLVLMPRKATAKQNCLLGVLKRCAILQSLQRGNSTFQVVHLFAGRQVNILAFEEGIIYGVS